jgi:glutamate-5-semialdehyde dehydrogenase
MSTNEATNSAKEVAERAKKASFLLQSTSSSQKSTALQQICSKLLENRQEILAANEKDLALAKISGTISTALLSRLNISSKFDSMVKGVKDVDSLPDPANKVLLARELSEGLKMYKVACPVGVLLIIFEARPEVVIQVTTLALKSGNAVLLKGGKEAFNTNRV